MMCNIFLYDIRVCWNVILKIKTRNIFFFNIILFKILQFYRYKILILFLSDLFLKFIYEIKILRLE